MNTQRKRLREIPARRAPNILPGLELPSQPQAQGAAPEGCAAGAYFTQVLEPDWWAPKPLYMIHSWERTSTFAA